MKLADIFKTLALGLTLLLAGCASPPQEAPRDEGVQDINPGERSVITAPSRESPAQDRLGERNI